MPLMLCIPPDDTRRHTQFVNLASGNLICHRAQRKEHFTLCGFALFDGPGLRKQVEEVGQRRQSYQITPAEIEHLKDMLREKGQVA